MHPVELSNLGSPWPLRPPGLMSSLARRRLLRDLAEVHREPSELVSALPLDDNIFEWHANLRPNSGPLAGVVFHVRIIFPQNYPDSPPNLLFPMKKIPSFVHPNLYSFGLCLDILSSFIGSHDQHAGWSPAYSVRTLLLQLQSFLFEFDAAPQDHGGTYRCTMYTKQRIAQVQAEAARLQCCCGHCRRVIYPPLASPVVASVSASAISSASGSADKAPWENPGATPISQALDALQAGIKEKQEWLRKARLMQGQFTAKGSTEQLMSSAGASDLKVRVISITREGFVRVGLCRSETCPLSLSWTSDGKLNLGNRMKSQMHFPRVAAGNVMEIALSGDSLEFRCNGERVDNDKDQLLLNLVKGPQDDAKHFHLVVEFRHAMVEVLPSEELDAVDAELQELRERESQLCQRKVADDVAAAAAGAEACRAAEAEAAERRRAAEAEVTEARRVAEVDAAARAWERVLQPPTHAVVSKKSESGALIGSRRLSWLRAEAVDLAKPLHEGSARGAWADLNPHLLLKAFMHLEFSDVAPLSRTCKVWRRLAGCSNLTERLQLRCFYLKTSAEEDVLGFGVNVEYHSDGNLKSLRAELDPLSARAFYKHQLRRSIWGDRFTHFLPLALSAEHCSKALPELERALAALACGPDARTRTFEPWMALAAIPQLMNTFVVALMRSPSKDERCNVVSRHASERALLGYCSFHHMLLALCQRHPSIAKVATEKVKAFVQGQRDKSKVPDLGQLVVYMTLAEGSTWQQVMSAIMDEAQVRGVLWVLRSCPWLGHRGVSDEELRSSTLKHRLTSCKLLMFQAHFLRSIARPGGEPPQRSLVRYNRQFGQPTDLQKEELVLATRQILQVSTWSQVFRALGLSVPAPDSLARSLRDAMVRSAALGYHGRGCAAVDRVGMHKTLQAAFASAGSTKMEMSQAEPQKLVPTYQEAEARKVIKKLADIKKLEDRKSSGEKLDRFQEDKIKRRSELEVLLHRWKL